MTRTSPIIVTAALSIAGLFAVFGTQLGTHFAAEKATVPPQEPVKAPSYVVIKDADGNGAPDWEDELAARGIALYATSSASSTDAADPLVSIGGDIAEALYGGYLSLKQYDSYTPERGEELGRSVAEHIRAPGLSQPYTTDDIALREATGESILAYRADMREALSPMITDEAPEIELYGRYLQTKDPLWLLRIALAAAHYREAEGSMRSVMVPTSALPEHLRALNALRSYAETLERLSKLAGDPLASIALVKSMQTGEMEMLTSFDALAKYYVRSIAQN